MRRGLSRKTIFSSNSITDRHRIQKNYRLQPGDTYCEVDIDTAGLTQILLSCYDLVGNWMATFYSVQ